MAVLVALGSSLFSGHGDWALAADAVPSSAGDGGPGTTVLDDRGLAGRFLEALGKAADSGELTPAADMQRQMTERTSCRIALATPVERHLDGAGVYAECAEGVLVVGGVYKCDRCSNWHTTTASGFVLTADGAVATNFHVIEGAGREETIAGFGVMTLSGRVLPVREVLAADKTSDVAIVRVDPGDEPLTPLALSSHEPVGAPVWIISHPDEEYFLLTGGLVSRYARSDDPASASEWMAVTAEFARGSSGGPVLNARGAVCGMVAHTRSIYYRGGTGGKEDSPFQMTLRSCVPAAAILALIESPDREEADADDPTGIDIAPTADPGASIDEASTTGASTVLPGSRVLEWEGDIASRLVDSAHAFLDRKLKESEENRWGRHWTPGAGTHADRDASAVVEANRERLRRIIGAVDSRTDPARMERLRVAAEGIGLRVTEVRWSAFADVSAEGLLLEPVGRVPVADVVVLGDADESPEALAGLVEGCPPERWLARRLAALGCRVLVPRLVDRGAAHEDISRREFLYRSAFVLGRHLVGYEVQKVLAAVDWMESAGRPAGTSDLPIAVAGYGEGGLIVLHAAALDERIDRTLVAGHFGPRDAVWSEPAYRNIFGLLERFGDAELAALVAPRALVVDPVPGPTVEHAAGGRAKPGRIPNPAREEVEAEIARARALARSLGIGEDSWIGFGGAEALLAELSWTNAAATTSVPLAVRKGGEDESSRRQRTFHELDRHNQQLLAESPYLRREFWKNLNTETPAAFSESVEPYREYFARDVIGRFDDPLLEANPRSRLVRSTDAVDVHEVVLDVFPDLFAHGLLLLPRGIAPGERRPVVVCQHGLEGRPGHLVGEEEGYASYKAYAMRLAERGFITFAPQNLYLFQDRFRLLQFKANAVGCTLFSMMVPQHQQITEWLASLPFVDPDRIAFYGLSYGGKSAMRIPPLVERYCLSICSADFNDWVWKNASSRSPFSYVRTGEYEIFEFDLGSTFNYAEMAALIAPRPFMVERGHFDGVAPDETVAYEFAKVRHLYQARLGLPEAAEIEWFAGPHTINGQGTFRFLHRHLDWPEP